MAAVLRTQVAVVCVCVFEDTGGSSSGGCVEDTCGSCVCVCVCVFEDTGSSFVCVCLRTQVAVVCVCV